MALKEYRFNGSTYQFDDDAVPDGAVLVEDEIDAGLAELEAKNAEAAKKQASAPANKARTADAK